MDTTAAAELGVRVVGPGVDGVGFWDGGTVDPDAWPDDDYEQMPDPSNSRGSEGGGGWGKGMNRRTYGRQSRPPSAGPEPFHKRMRSMPGDMQADNSGSQGYGGRPGSGGYAVGQTYNGVSGPMYGASDMGMGSQSSRGNTGYSSGMVGGMPQQGGMKGNSSFQGDFNSGLGPSTPASSGGSGAVAASATGKGRGTGSIFFKTKLCSKFRAGICPYSSNCNFAHGMEELRKPPPGWEEIVAAQEAERALRGRDAQSQPPLTSQGSGGGSSDSQRFHKTRPCKKYYSDEGCPYGDRCNFLHDDQVSQARLVARESNAINLGPPMSTGSGGNGGAGNGGERLPNWKMRICNKWETTGQCPFGQKCHFSHGVTDGYNSAPISRYGGGAAVSLPLQTQRQSAKPVPEWKGLTDEISTIYGDWIEEDEWEHPPFSTKQAADQAATWVNESSPDEMKDEKMAEVQQPKQQDIKQLNVPFYRGDINDNTGQRQNSFAEAAKNESKRTQRVASDLGFNVDRGFDEEDAWGGEL